MIKNKISKLLLVFAMAFLSLPLTAQQPVTQDPQLIKQVKADTANKPILKKSDFPKPKTALLWSIIPTGGQFYNQKYWYIKVPIALGGYAFGVNRVVVNGNDYRKYQSEYFNLVNSPEGPNAYGASFKKQQRDEAFKAYQQSWVFISIWHLFCAAEAFTAAHLAHFDVSEDLSWQIRRGLKLSPVCSENGFGIQLKF
jgi:hypothetical protein